MNEIYDYTYIVLRIIVFLFDWMSLFYMSALEKFTFKINNALYPLAKKTHPPNQILEFLL